MAASRSFLEDIARRAMLDRGFESDFSSAALAQVARLHPSPLSDAQRDLRDLPWCSIDNEDSRDLDQLSVAGPTSSGSETIFIAIADVDALVARDSPIDQHAAHNTTSIYTGAKVFPMLPERLSTDLTSLGEGEDRSAVVIEYVVGADGAVGATSVYPALVHNWAKLAYSSVGPWLEGTGPMPEPIARHGGLEDNLRRQDAAAHALKARRHEQGALTLESSEARPVFENETLRDLAEHLTNRATELIEDFMIAANGVVARFLGEQGRSSLRRVVRDPERWPRIIALAEQTGDSLPRAPDAFALEQWLQRQRAEDPIHFPDLSLAVIKLLGRGEYVVERPGHAAAGHFGLAVQDYTHSTAPNRRFPDLVTQRLLKAALAKQPAPYSDDQLSAIAIHCTEREDAANKVERFTRKAAAAILLQSRIGDRFDAIVTGASEKGTWVRIRKPSVEGRLERGSEGLEVGDRVRVRLVHTDPTRGFIDFHRA
jgi:exoribonuclease-2